MQIFPLKHDTSHYAELVLHEALCAVGSDFNDCWMIDAPWYLDEVENNRCVSVGIVPVQGVCETSVCKPQWEILRQ